MTKKESEEYATKECCTTCKALNCKEKCECWTFATKGAEFGYNKANEWHKQDTDDIYDIIAEDWDIKYFICIMKDKSRVTAIGNCDEGCNGDVSINLLFEHDNEKYYIDDIVWWKEIELPKEIKEK